MGTGADSAGSISDCRVDDKVHISGVSSGFQYVLFGGCCIRTIGVVPYVIQLSD